MGDARYHGCVSRAYESPAAACSLKIILPLYRQVLPGRPWDAIGRDNGTDQVGPQALVALVFCAPRSCGSRLRASAHDIVIMKYIRLQGRERPSCKPTLGVTVREIGGGNSPHSSAASDCAMQLAAGSAPSQRSKVIVGVTLLATWCTVQLSVLAYTARGLAEPSRLLYLSRSGRRSHNQ